MKHLFGYGLILAMTALAACGHSESAGHKQAGGPLLPLPEAVPEPDENALRAAVREYLSGMGAPASSVYKFARDDLNGDRRREALVLFNNPYGYWCDFYGCQMLILKAHEKRFTPVNMVRRVRGPLYISENTTNGWKDLIVHISGRWSNTKDVALQFDGVRYPTDPESLPEADFSAGAGRRVLHD